MTVYCANCGAQIKAGGKFCQACGTPTPQPSGPTEAATMRMPSPAPPPAALYGAPPYGHEPMVTTQRKSGGALKVVLIVLAVIVVFGAVAIIGGIYFVKRAVEQVQIKGGDGGPAEVSISLPGGKFSASAKVTEEQLGVPLYPGAKAEQGAGGITVMKGDGKSAFIGGATFTTDDSVEQVAKFYKDKLGEKAKIIETTSNDRHEVVLKMVSGEALRTIVISNNGSSPTKIAIANVAK